MSTPEENGPDGRTEAREAARAKASRMRAEQKKRDRRNRVLLTSSIAAGVLGVLVIVAVVLVQAIRPAGPAPQNMAEDGIVIGQDLQVVAVPASAAPAEATPGTLGEAIPASPLATGAPAAPEGDAATGSAPAAAPPAEAQPPAEATPAAATPDASAPAPSTEPSAPITTAPAPADDAVEIRVYTDYICPECAIFDAANHDTLQRWVSTGAATLQVHPLAMFDNQSLGAKYSTRAANAASCVANFSPGAFFAVNHALFEAQPEQQTAGLDDAALKKLVRTAGADNLAQIETCIDERTFSGWVAAATKRAMNGPLPGTTLDRVTGTPLVLVNGELYEGAADDPDEFLAFLTQHAGRTFATASPAPGASPDAD